MHFGTSPHFAMEAAPIEDGGDRLHLTVTRGGKLYQAEVAVSDQNSWIDFFSGAAGEFGTRLPGNRRPRDPLPSNPCLRPILTEAASPEILYGFGDPWVIRSPEAEFYYLVATSNDAEQSFPIMRSSDFTNWELVRFAFPRDHKPAWAATGVGKSDYWAPEIHAVNGRYLLCFSARQTSGELAIGIAFSSNIEGPFETAATPLKAGGVIDAHLFADRSGEVYLYWKDDNNDRWPRLLMDLLVVRPELAPMLFPAEQDQLTIEMLLAFWGWTRDRPAMQRFFVLQLLVEAATERYSTLRDRFRALADEHPSQGPAFAAILEAMHTPVHGQRLCPRSLTLLGEPFPVIRNDLEWEGPLIEGMCMTLRGGLYYLVYSGNDFSTPHYGIGYAVGESPRGPFQKPERPLLTSTKEWWGPGHPSIVDAPDGRPLLFMHAYRAGRAGYKVFRAVLAAGLRFEAGKVTVEAPHLPHAT